MVKNIGNFEAAMKVINVSHPELISAFESGDVRRVKQNVDRIRSQLVSAFFALADIEETAP